MEKINDVKSKFPSDWKLPNVYLLHGSISDEEINELYNHPKVKAHISLTKGEGFGRPLLEATISQKPVIASAWSGHTDFLEQSKAILLPGELTQVHPSAVWDKVVIPESKWFTVNYQTASKVLTDVHKNYKNYIPNEFIPIIQCLQRISKKGIQITFLKGKTS